MASSYSIAELAAEFGITTRAIRFYEEKELLSPRRVGSARVYSAADRVTLKLILRGKRLGFSLAESRDIIALYDPARGNKKQLQSLLDKILEKRAQLEQQRHEIGSLLRDLKAAEKNCREAMLT